MWSPWTLETFSSHIYNWRIPTWAFCTMLTTTMCFQFSVLNFYHPHGSHLKGQIEPLCHQPLFFFDMFLVFYQAGCCWSSSSWDSALRILSNFVEFQICCCSSSSSCLNDRCFSTSSARSIACSVLVIPTSHDPWSQLAATFDACSELAATFCFELSCSLVEA